MTGERTMPGGPELLGFWTPGSGGFAGAPGMDDNWRKIGAGLASRLVVESRTTDPLPASPASPVIYIVDAGDATNPNKIAVWDGPSGSETWVYYDPFEGLEAYVRDAPAGSKKVEYDGTTWNAAASGSSATGFSAYQTAAQSVSATASNLNCQDKSTDPDGFDPLGAYDLVSDVCTIPAAWDGRYGIFSGGLHLQANVVQAFHTIERSTDGGSTWKTIATTDQGGDTFGRTALSTRIVKLKTGEKWRFRVTASSTESTNVADPDNFFALAVL